MISPLSSAGISAANLTPEQIAGNSALTDSQKVAEMSRQFEAVLLRQILTEAHKPVFKSSMALGSSTAAVHQDMLINEMANQMTRGGGAGLATQLTKDLGRQFKAENDEAACEAAATRQARPLFSTEPTGSTSSARWIR
jgi:Rod binding domain-containing protein